VDGARARQAIRDRALALGFDAVGFAPADIGPEAGRNLAEFLARGHHGDMGWMAKTAERRGHPNRLWPEARTIVAVGASYAPAASPLDDMHSLAAAARGHISVYARGGDYHDTLKRRLRALARWVSDEWVAEVRIFVDTAPLMEKAVAERAGIGWHGKHTNLVSRSFGSWLFLGELATTLEVPPDAAERDHCGSCRRCLDACPTKAFPAPYQIDARRCISYLTIEHKGHIAQEFRAAMGNRVYGCDDCLAVCPWNKFARSTRDIAFLSRAELTGPRLADLAALDDAAFRKVFAGTAIKRTGRDRFVRNVLIAIGNSGDGHLAPAAEARLSDASPLVRAMAVWALSRLLEGGRFETLRARHLKDEKDPSVRSEWDPKASTRKEGARQTAAEPSSNPDLGPDYM
jgi:epoxyqueuosine reductase